MDTIHKPQREPCFLLAIRDSSHKERRIVDLHQNHRSHGTIIAWSNRYLYEDTMRDYGNTRTTYHLIHSDLLPTKGFSIIFHSIKNIHEASVIYNYCVKLTRDTERKICERGAFLVSLFFGLPRRRRGGYCRSRTLQSPGQGHSRIIKGSRVVGDFCGLS